MKKIKDDINCGWLVSIPDDDERSPMAWVASPAGQQMRPFARSPMRVKHDWIVKGIKICYQRATGDEISATLLKKGLAHWYEKHDQQIKLGNIYVERNDGLKEDEEEGKDG